MNQEKGQSCTLFLCTMMTLYNSLGSYIKIIYTQVTENYSALLQTRNEAHCFLEQFFSKVFQEI